MKYAHYMYLCLLLLTANNSIYTTMDLDREKKLQIKRAKTQEKRKQQRAKRQEEIQRFRKKNEIAKNARNTASANILTSKCSESNRTERRLRNRSDIKNTVIANDFHKEEHAVQNDPTQRRLRTRSKIKKTVIANDLNKEEHAVQNDPFPDGNDSNHRGMHDDFHIFDIRANINKNYEITKNQLMMLE